MARSVNKVILLGNLGRDAELSYTPSGQALSKVGLATSRRWQDKNSGEWQEETDWHNLVIWGKTAESLTPYLTKGKQIYVEGRIKYREWEKEGQKHRGTDIVVDRVVFVGTKADSAGDGEARPRAATANAARPAAKPPTAPPPTSGPPPDEGPQEDISEDDIPF